MQLSTQLLKLLSGLAALLLVTACSSTANTSAGSSGTPDSANANSVAQTDEDPLICKFVIPSGTRIGHEVCIRKSEKDRMRENAQTVTIENQRRAVLGSPVGN